MTKKGQAVIGTLILIVLVVALMVGIYVTRAVGDVIENIESKCTDEAINILGTENVSCHIYNYNKVKDQTYYECSCKYFEEINGSLLIREMDNNFYIQLDEEN